MKGYTERALIELNFIGTKTKPTYSPTTYTTTKYGKKIQYVIRGLPPKLDIEAIDYIKKVTVTFVYSARAVDKIIQHVLNDLEIATTKVQNKQ